MISCHTHVKYESLFSHGDQEFLKSVMNRSKILCERSCHTHVIFTISYDQG